MRDSGFIQLPSARTLFDYSHFTQSALGFHSDVTKMLHEEAKKLILGTCIYTLYVHAILINCSGQSWSSLYGIMIKIIKDAWYNASTL